MNALNTGWDLFLPKPYKDGGSADNGWEIAGLKTAVRVNGRLNDSRNRDKGWTLEIAIPWKAFGQAARMPLPPVAGNVWRVNFSRVEWRHELHEGKYRRVPGTKEDNWVWSPQGKVNMHLPEHWGYVQFAEKAGGGFGGKPAWAARMELQSYYQRQYDFRKEKGRWATAEEVPAGAEVQMRHPVDGMWRACIGGLCIRQDAKIELI